MKSLKTKSIKMKVLLTLILLLTSVSVFAQNEYADTRYSKNEIKSLTNAITSENDGLRKSGIYLAGLYEVNEVTNALITQLKKEKDPKTKILIALSLYKIGGIDSYDVIKYLSKNDEDAKVRRISSAIFNEISIGLSENR